MVPYIVKPSVSANDRKGMEAVALRFERDTNLKKIIPVWVILLLTLVIIIMVFVWIFELEPILSDVVSYIILGILIFIILVISIIYLMFFRLKDFVETFEKRKEFYNKMMEPYGYRVEAAIADYRNMIKLLEYIMFIKKEKGMKDEDFQEVFIDPTKKNEGLEMAD